MKVLIHAQHLSGVGHHVRAAEIARHLARGRGHRVVLVDGGWPVPRAGSDAALRLVLPRIGRQGGALVPLDAGASLPRVLAERRRRLVRCATSLAPDVLLVEHYPFSKWELEPEILGAVAAARAANPSVRVVCSVRDVCRPTRHEELPPAALARRVEGALRSHFDAVLVHADERFTRLEEHFPGDAARAAPVFHTGFVCERRAGGAALATPPQGHAVLSVGGGAGSVDFALRAMAAWRRLHAEGVTRLPLVVFAGLLWSEADRARVRAAAAGGPFVLRPFGADLLEWLGGASLSISRAGYNTCTNLLETRCRALVVPDPRMSDQAFRARRLAALGLVEALAPEGDTGSGLAEAMARALQRPPPRHDLDLEGARRTGERLASLVLAGPDLLALARDRAAPLSGLTPITTLPSPVRRRAAFALDFADGVRLKGRRLRSAARAREVACWMERAGDGLPRVLARRGDALLIEWVTGPTLASLPRVPPELLHRCGEWLGALHRRGGSGVDATDPAAGGVDALLAALGADAAAVEAAGACDPDLLRRAVETARSHRPEAPSVGLIHRDFCAENLVRGPLGLPVSIDNASLAIGPHDFDLGRTWSRWPMTRAERECFLAGYEKQRSPSGFLAAFPFWACYALLASAAKRVRSRTGREAEPLARLERLLEQLARDPRAEAAAWAS